MKSIDDSIKAIKSGATDKYKMLIVVESVADAEKLIKGTQDSIKTLNLGGTKAGENTVNYSKTINLTHEDEEILVQLQQSDVDIYIQQVPNEDRQEFVKK
jgi:fructoselysine and glucoselysine-specific PTS system IIB component